MSKDTLIIQYNKSTHQYMNLLVISHNKSVVFDCNISFVFNIIQGDSLARGPKLLSIKITLLRIENLYTDTGNDAKQDLLIIDAENDLLSHPSTLECVSPNSGILFPKCRC